MTIDVFINLQKSNSHGKMKMPSENKSSCGFTKWYKAQEIIGAKKINGTVVFIIKW